MFKDYFQEMIDLRKPLDLEKIGWYFSGFVKLNVVGLIIVLCFLLAVRTFLFLKDFVIFEIAIISGFFIFFSLSIILIILINKYRFVERLADDWYQKK